MEANRIDRTNRLHTELESLIPSEWDRLVRLCASSSGEPDVAEDLAQETLIEAWRHAAKLRDPNAIRPWLAGIARNVCRRWRRRQAQEQAKTRRAASEAPGMVRAAESSSVELALACEDLAFLLDRAMDHLTDAARDVLVQYHIEGRSYAEIGARLNLSGGAVAVRAHRGRQALKQALMRPELRGEAIAGGLALPDPNSVQRTRVWCPFCGRHRLQIHREQEARMLTVSCAGSCFHSGTIIGSKRITPGSSALSSPKSIIARELLDLHSHYCEARITRGGSCHRCGHPMTLGRWSFEPGTALGNHLGGIQLWCHACGLDDRASLWHLLLDTPDVQRLWRRHPRVRAIPLVEIEVDGSAALVSGFASLDSSDRIEIVSHRDTGDMLRIDGAIAR